MAKIAPWIYLLNFVITSFAALISCILSLLLLRLHWKKLLVTAYTPAMHFYFLFVSFSSAVTLSYTVYHLIYWSPNESVYNAYILFYGGIVSNQLHSSVAIIEVFLCIERCLSILLLGYYSTRCQKTLLLGCGIVIFIFSAVYGFAANEFGDTISSSTTSCYFMACLLSPFASNFNIMQKILSSLIIIIGGSCIAYITRTRLTTTIAIKRLNTIVVYMNLLAFVFTLIPNTLSYMSPLVLNFRLSKMLGPYSTTLTAIYVTGCVILYWTIFQKGKLKKSYRDLSPQTTRERFKTVLTQQTKL